MTFDQFFEFVRSNECFELHDVSIIDEDGNQHYVDQTEYYSYLANISLIIAGKKDTIKIEQMETHWNWDDRTIHVFYNPKDGPTFDIHTDPVDVIIECKDGIKYMEVDGKEIRLFPGDKLSIPANTPHRALNYEQALMASHGISDTETLNSIR